MRLILFRISICAFSILAIVSCVSKPAHREEANPKGQWETKAQLKDLKNQKTHNLSISFWSIQPDRLRAEVNGPFGVSVASLGLIKNHYELAVHTQKKFYSGTATEASLAKLLGMKLDPRILIYVLFDRPLPANQWQCSLDSGNLLKECRSKNSDLTVKWSERDGELKRLTFTKADYELQILVKDFSTNVQDDDGFFRVKAPAAYTTHQSP